MSNAVLTGCRFAALTIFAAVAGVADLSAQDAHGQTYMVAGPGRFGEDAMGYTAFGGEYIGYRLGVAGEVGFLFGARPDAPGGPARSTMVGGFYLVVPFTRASMSYQPFVVGGLGFLGHAIGDSSIAYVVGGGTNIWVTKRVGLRTELRVPLGFSSNNGVTAGLGLTVR
jgi:hypothetical protein